MPVPTSFGFRAAEAFELLPEQLSTTYGLWRNTEGAGDTVQNRADRGNGDFDLGGTDLENIWELNNRLFGNGSLEFNAGANDRRSTSQFSAITDISTENRFTWAGWIRAASAGEGGTIGTVFDDEGQFLVQTIPGGDIRITMDTGGGLVSAESTSGFLNYGSPDWFFVAFTYDGTTPLARLYAARQDEAALTIEFSDVLTWSGAVVQNTNDLLVGYRNQSVPTDRFDGLVGPMLYLPERALTEPNLNDLFVRPWFYFTQRPNPAETAGVLDSVVMQKTADADVIRIELSTARRTFGHYWRSTLNDIDRFGFEDFWINVIRSGVIEVFLINATDRRGVTERFMKFTESPFQEQPDYRPNMNTVELFLLELP